MSEQPTESPEVVEPEPVEVEPVVEPVEIDEPAAEPESAA
jgi:hypothetical protein